MNKSLMMQVHNYAKLWGVRVKVQGTSAYTNGTDITIPMFNISDEHSCRLACAYLAHESGHIAYSDFKILSRIPKDERLLHTLLNIVEDSRIERLMSKKWVGVYENLLMLNHELSKIAVEKLNSLQGNTINLIPRMLQITSWLCQKYIQQYNTDNYILSILNVYPCLQDFTDKLSELLMNAPMCIDTYEAYVVAKKINTLFKKEYSAIKEKPQQIQRNLIDSIDNTDAEGTPISIDVKDAEGTPISIDIKDSEDNEDDTCSTNITDFDTGIEAFTTWSTQSTIETCVSTSSKSFKRDNLGIISECPRVEAGNVDWLKCTGLSVKINSLTLALHNYVKAKTLATSEQVDVGRNLNVKRAIRIPLGETNIWNEKTYDLDHNTSIHILVDSSSSMLFKDSGENFPNYSLRRIDHAKICAYCIAKALEGVPNTESQVSFFPGNNKYAVGICKQSLESVKSTMKYFDQKPSGSTPMAQAMAYALTKFKYSDKDRNILLIITDGMPDSVSNVKEQLEQCKHLGIELRVLSINCEIAQKLFPNCVVTDASVLMDNASKVIKQLFN